MIGQEISKIQSVEIDIGAVKIVTRALITILLGDSSADRSDNLDALMFAIECCYQTAHADHETLVSQTSYGARMRRRAMGLVEDLARGEVQ